MRIFRLPLYILSLFYILCCGYRPVVILHAAMSWNGTLRGMGEKIQKAHPGTKIYMPDEYANRSSLMPMWMQVLSFGSDVMRISNNYPGGIHLIGFSQGGLIGRGIIEAYRDHNIKTFISLSAPQGGQFGASLLHSTFPNLTLFEAYKFFYSNEGQRSSVGNYWRDPFHDDLYLQYSDFLPFIDNDKSSPDKAYFKNGITRLQKMVLIGGPDDGVVGPWQSSHFAFYDEECNVVEIQDQKQYRDDTIGLKTLHDTNRLQIVSVAGVIHTDWHNNDSVIYKYIVPNLD